MKLRIMIIILIKIVNKKSIYMRIEMKRIIKVTLMINKIKL